MTCTSKYGRLSCPGDTRDIGGYVKKTIFLAAALAVIVTTVVLGADSVNVNLKGVRYIVTYTESYHDNPVAMDITFYGTRPSGYRAEQILAANMTSSAALMPDQDILGTAWFSSAGDTGDIKTLPFKDGVFHLAYSAEEKRLLSWAEYQKKIADKRSKK